MSNITSFQAVLGDDGRFVIPAAERRRLGLKAGDTLIGESDGTSIRVRNQQAVLRETQEYFRQFAKPGISVVDELLEERRAEAAREEAETTDSLARAKRD